MNLKPVVGVDRKNREGFDRPDTKQELSSGDLVICEVCGGKISRFAKVCPHCGDPVLHENLSAGLDGCLQALLRAGLGLVFLYVLVSAGCSSLLKSCGMQ